MKVKCLHWREAQAYAQEWNSLIESLHFSSSVYRHRRLWKLRYSLKAFKPRAHIMEYGAVLESFCD
jgi:hypothetical protein